MIFAQAVAEYGALASMTAAAQRAWRGLPIVRFVPPHGESDDQGTDDEQSIQHNTSNAPGFRDVPLSIGIVEVRQAATQGQEGRC